MKTVVRSLSDVQEQLAQHLEKLRNYGCTPSELGKLTETVAAFGFTAERARKRYVEESHAPYFPGRAGHWFRTLPPSGRCRYFETRVECEKHARTQSKRLHDTVAVEEWSPGEHQDELNRGWACYGVFENGELK